MNQFIAKAAFLLLYLILCEGMCTLYAQSVAVSGNVSDIATNEPLSGVNITIKGKLAGTVTNSRGDFTLTTNTIPPFTLVVSTVGYETQETVITSSQSNLNLAMKERIVMGQEVVVAASRIKENFLQSPVTIEKMDIGAIRAVPATSFYEGLGNLKGIDMNTQSLTFRSVNTRGFNANRQVRIVQLIDGMDNQAPGLSFPVGNIVGISELDLESVEILPGAASALYGPNAIQGIILMNSKSPFQYQGLSATTKLGSMNLGKADVYPSMLNEVAVRYAKAFSNRFAFKVNAYYLRSQDWQATDLRNKNNEGWEGSNRQTNPNYNGVNVYGDENSVNLQAIVTNPAFVTEVLNPLAAKSGLSVAQLQSLVPSQFVTRTGYLERDLVNYNAENLKLNAALHFRISDNLEAILQGNYGTGTTVNTAADRYSLTGFDLSQYKAELKGSNFFLRAYTTLERSGDSYAGGTFGELLNEAYSPSQTKWFPEYTTAYLLARLGTLPGGLQTNEQAHSTARSIADRYRLIPGTPEFNAAKDQITNTALPKGARFTDKTNLYHVEGMYNFNQLTDFAEVIIGANYRMYDLNSEGTVFLQENDSKEFNIHEYGGYIQAAKKVLGDRFKITGSIRYDKNQNFKGQFSPRLSGVYTFAKTHNIRLSYQTGFRIPATQDQYINLVTPQATLIGGLPIFRDRYNFNKNPVYSKDNLAAFGAAVQTSASSPTTVQQATNLAKADAAAGRIPATPQAIEAAAKQYAVGIGIQSSVNVLQPYQFKEFSPEHVQSYEIGYKSLIANKLIIDSYYYFNSYKNFSGQQIVIQSDPNGGPSNPAALLGLAGTRTVFVFPESSSGKITSHGWALGLDYALPDNFMIGGNIAYNALIKSDPNLAQTQFNTPKYRSNISFGNRSIIKNLGFNIVWRWQDAFVWESSFTLPATHTVVPAFHTIDAQISYKIPSIKSILKIGGSNLLNNYYTQAFGNPSVGGLYYISLSFDELLR